VATPPTAATKTETSLKERARAAAQTKQTAKAPHRNPAPATRHPHKRRQISAQITPNRPIAAASTTKSNLHCPLDPRREPHADPRTRNLSTAGGERRTWAALVDGRDRPAEAETDADDATAGGAAAAASIARGNPSPARSPALTREVAWIKKK